MNFDNLSFDDCRKLALLSLASIKADTDTTRQTKHEQEMFKCCDAIVDALPDTSTWNVPIAAMFLAFQGVTQVFIDSLSPEHKKQLLSQLLSDKPDKSIKDLMKLVIDNSDK